MYSPQDLEEKEEDNKLLLRDVNSVVDVCAESISIGIYEMAVNMKDCSCKKQQSNKKH